MEVASLSLVLNARPAREGADEFERSTKKIKREAQSAAAALKKLSRQAGSAFGRLKTQTSGLTSAFERLGVASAFRQLVRTSAEFERLRASLVTVTGSARDAERVFSQIQTFAATTPFQLQEVTEAFIKMKALGLDASEKALRSYGNTAAATGKSLSQFVEAVADAATGEFERLKDFGIRARSEGENVTFSFREMTTTVRKDASEITAYLKRLGDVEFAGGMDRQAKSLSVALGNLGDAASRFLDEIGKGGFSDAIATVARRLTETSQGAENLAHNLGRFLGNVVLKVGDAFEWLANNMRLVIVASGALMGMKLGAVLGPWGIAIGGIAGLLGGAYASDVLFAKDRTLEFKRAIQDSKDAMAAMAGNIWPGSGRRMGKDVGRHP